MVPEPVIITLISSASAIVAVIVNNALNKKKAKAETESLVFKMQNEFLEEARKELKHDREQIEENKQTIKKLQQVNEDCEFEHLLTKLQLKKLMKRINMENWHRAMVYVLDDNPMTTMLFEQKFKSVVVVYFKSFTDPKLFLDSARKEKPEILVLDYYLSDKLTACDIISELQYEPEIFIMSQEKEVELKFKGGGVRFFYKDKNFVRDITKAILEFLVARNSITE